MVPLWCLQIPTTVSECHSSVTGQLNLDHPGLGLKATTELIDNRTDFKVYMQNYAYARGGGVVRGPRREGPQDEGFVSKFASMFNFTL